MTQQTKIVMGMPVTVQIVDSFKDKKIIDKIFLYFNYVDKNFSIYKEDSETSLINQGKLKKSEFSKDMKTILRLSKKTKEETNGYFDVMNKSKLDPLGLVKGWAILKASQILKKEGIRNFYIEAGGDIQFSGKNEKGEEWKIGIRNPFNINEIIKVVHLNNKGVATSGTYIRGKHIYNPKDNFKPADKIMSLTVIGPNVYEADRFATAAFAMGKDGVNFIERLDGFEGYSIDCRGIATMTSGFEKYVN